MNRKIINKEFGLSSGDNIVVKVGSNILAGNNDGINLKNMKNIVNGINYLMEIGLNVFLVSSGAVAVGKNNFEAQGNILNEKINFDEKALLSGIGQIDLMYFYRKLFNKKNILIAQNLLTHKNFKDENVLKNLQNVWKNNIKYRVLAIINENDTISREELKFSDNDELAGLIAKNIKAKMLILLSDIDGVYKDFGTENRKIITEINNISEVRKYCKESDGKGVGSGGMNSKLNVMEKIIEENIIGILANGGEKNILQDIFLKEKNLLQKIFYKNKKTKKTIFKKTGLNV